MKQPIINEIATKQHFAQLLNDNPGIFIIKFGAEWCGPCKKIEKQVDNFMNQMPDNIACAIIDIDDCFELYAFLKNKKMVTGIPTVLAYYKGNLSYIPDDSTVGADVNQLFLFFKRCNDKAITMVEA